MKKTKKVPHVVVIIIEGKSEEVLLTKFFNDVYKKYDSDPSVTVQLFKVQHPREAQGEGGDIFTEYSGVSLPINERICEQCLKPNLEKNKLSINDVREVVIITDTDGAFIDDKYIHHNSSAFDPNDPKAKKIINNNGIITKNYQISHKLKRAHHIKRHNVYEMLRTKVVQYRSKEIPLSIYYMSVNLDHVFYDEANLRQNKVVLAAQFVKTHPEAEDLLAHIKPYSCQTSYIKSWMSLEEETNSLKRATNLNLLVDKLKSGE